MYHTLNVVFHDYKCVFLFSSICGLTAELRGYQKKAVQWMVDKEKGVERGGTRSLQLHPLWKELNVPRSDPSTLYFNPHTGR